MGAGTWGTTFGLVVCDSGHEVTLWARRPELAAAINADHRNPDYLPDVDLPPALRAVSDPAEAMDGAYAVVLAVPSQLLRATLIAHDVSDWYSQIVQAVIIVVAVYLQRQRAVLR